MTNETLVDFQNRPTTRPLPDGWTWTTIGEIAKTTSGGTPSRKRPEYYGGTIPWVKSGELGDSIVTSVSETITEEGLKNSSAKIFPKGTALVALYGATVGKTGILGIDAATNQAVCAIFPEDGLFTTKYMTYWLRSQRDTLIGLSSGGAQPNISQTIVKAFHFPLAPLPVQERIVAEIEKQFTRLDQAVASLRRLQSNLARYKASVLKAACDGRLVPQDPGDSSESLDEPADQLLARILAARRARWQAANPGKKYKEPVGVEETAVLPDLPEGWVWARFEQLLHELKNGNFSKAPDSEPPGIPILRISAVRSLSVDLSEPRFLREKMSAKIENYLLENNDLLFTRYNGNLHYVGVCGVVRNLKEATIYPDKLIRARVASEKILPSYLEIYFAAPFARRYIEQRAKSTAGQHGIAGVQLLNVPVMIPPLAEQERIVAEVERRLSVVTAVEQTITASLSRAERLRQSILHRAFTGQLVPQEGVA